MAHLRSGRAYRRQRTGRPSRAVQGRTCRARPGIPSGLLSGRRMVLAGRRSRHRDSVLSCAPPAEDARACTRCWKWKAARPSGASSFCVMNAATPSITPIASHRSDKWRAIFGSPETEYAPETYRPRPYSRGFVRHFPTGTRRPIPTRISPKLSRSGSRSRPSSGASNTAAGRRSRNSNSSTRLMEEAKSSAPKVPRGRRISDASKLRKTLARYYAERRKLYAEDFPDFYDADLRGYIREWRAEAGIGCKRHATESRRAGRIHRALDADSTNTPWIC